MKRDVTKDKKNIEGRIRSAEAAIKIAHEYLETGAHADFAPFRPLFVEKYKDGKPCPPHKDWVRNVYIKHCHKRIARLEKALKRLDH